MAETTHDALAGELLRLTREMVEAARARDWPGVASREAERRRINARLFAEPIPQAQRAVVAQAIEKVLAYDPELNELATDARDESANDVQDAQANRKAVRAYHRYSAD
ncbi:hypothetical protein J2T57_002759 [Natronocella acetinitrilica]|uniref:Flagellar protein FliT n=1 Tax=Natronocella acetinitrilica TaxID=414046 RepID=A0AAE3G4Q4_9GAMM|nr:hypothetical protein [Natronocella acetinitrilica]